MICSIFFCVGGISQDNDETASSELEGIVIPSIESLPLNPTLQQVETAIANFNTLNDRAVEHETQTTFLAAKRDLAKIAADSLGITRRRNLRNFTVAASLSGKVGMINAFIESLLNPNSRIDRLQTWAELCIEVDDYKIDWMIPYDVYRGKQHEVASVLKSRYDSNNSGSSSSINSLILLPLRYLSYPTVVYPRFRCFGETTTFLPSGDCDDTFDTPYKARDTHEIWCGGYKDPDRVRGCNDSYYSCQKKPLARHGIKTCTLTVTYYKPGTLTVIGSEPCGIGYRTCTNPKMPHNFYKTASGRAGAVNFYASRSHSTSNNSDDDDDTASTLSTPDPPSMHACNIHPTSDSGDHTSTYVCDISPCSNRVVPGCLAICPETGNHGKVVCTISGCQDSTSYDPTSSSAGLHAYCNECYQYKCNGVDHSWQTSCSDTTHTNTNGDSCTATGFYGCVSHTPVYLSSDNGNNDDADDDSGDSVVMVTCSNCTWQYDSSDASAVERHTVPKTCSACGQPFTACSNDCSAEGSFGIHYE